MINCPACGSPGSMVVPYLASWHCNVCGADFSEDGELLADGFDSYEEAIEYDECDMHGHDWIDNSAGETVCQRCGASYYEEEGP